MNTSEITSMMVARAEPKPIRLASPMILAMTSVPISSRPLVPLLITQTMSKARSASITVTTRMMMLMGRITENTTEKRPWPGWPRPPRSLPQRGVDALQPGQVQQHDVAGVLPAGGHQHRPQVPAGVAVPVNLGVEDGVEQPLVARVHQLPGRRSGPATAPPAGTSPSGRSGSRAARSSSTARNMPNRVGSTNRNTSQTTLWVRAGLNGG